MFRYGTSCNRVVYLKQFLPVITFNYFVHFLLYFYGLIREKGDCCRNCMQKCILKGKSGLRLNFVVTVKWFAVFVKSSQFTLEGIDFCECWVMASFPWLANQVSQEFSTEHFALKGPAEVQPWVVTVLLIVLNCGSFIVHLERNLIVSIHFLGLLFTSYIPPQTTSVTITEETKLQGTLSFP